MSKDGFMMVKPAAGGWVVETNIYIGNRSLVHANAIAATPEQLVDRVLEFAALTAGGEGSLADAVAEREREVASGT